MPAKPHATPHTHPHVHPHDKQSRSARRMPAVAAAAFVVAVVAVATPATLAHAAPSATVSPGTVAPGGRVGLNIEGCGTKTGRVTSTAFGEVRLTPGNLEATNLFGSATVLRNASLGEHRVTFECGGAGGQRVIVSLQVTPGAARGGTGGSIGSMSPGQIAVGGSLVAAALGSGVWLMRRRGNAAA